MIKRDILLIMIEKTALKKVKVNLILPSDCELSLKSTNESESINSQVWTEKKSNN